MNTNATTAPFQFGGEAFLSTPLPDYPAERLRLTILLIAAVIGWIVVVPYVSGRLLLPRTTTTQEEETPTKSNVSTEKKSGGKKRKNKKRPGAPKGAAAEVDEILTNISGIMGLVSVAFLVWKSSVNSFASRAVFEAPMFSPEECQQILDFAYQAAQQNADRAAANETSVDADLLKEPIGWQKSRHSNYETTDLNLVTDPFSREQRDYISTRMDARLAPLIERIFGVTPRAIRADDMFVVRYHAEERTFLDNHTDAADISFNILLSDEFEGGGTQFWNRYEERPFAHVQPKKGQVLTHSALIEHEGMPVTKGFRYILVGFLDVDHIDPFTAEPTGLSWFNSWFSLPFLHRKVKDGSSATKMRRLRTLLNISPESKWTDSKYFRSLFRDLLLAIENIGDFLAPHIHHNLVAEENKSDYLKAMDESFRAQENPPVASWFRGQHIDRDVNGVLFEEKDPRLEDGQRFSEL